MRNSSGSLVIWVLFGIIILAFIFLFGAPSDSLGCGSTNEYSIKVKDKEVSMHSWRFSYASIPIMHGTTSGNERRPMSLEYLLQREILAQAAEELDFQVSDDLVDKAISQGELYLLAGRKVDVKSAYFKDGGFFIDYLKKFITGRMGLTSIASYKKEQKREILAYFMKEELIQSATVSEEEVRDAYIRSNTTVSANYVTFDVAKYRSKLKQSEEDVSSYASNHEEELKKEWELVKARWESEKKRVRARIIKVSKKLPPNAKDEEQDLSDPGSVSINKAQIRIEKGEAFSDVAKEMSEDNSASLGGLIGWRSAESMGYGQEVVDGAKELEIGKVSKVIEAKNAYFLVLIEERNEKGLGFDQKKLDLAVKAAPKELAKQKAKADAEKTLAKAKLQPLQELYRPSIQQNGIPQSVLDQLTPEQRKQILNSKIPGSESGHIVVEGPTRLAQVGGQQPTEKETAPPAPSPAVEETPVAEAKPTPKNENKKLKEPPVVVEAPKPLQTVPLQLKPVQDSDVPPPTLEVLNGATRNGDYIAGIGRSKKLVSDIFGTMTLNDVAPTVYEIDDGNSFIVIQLTDRSDADMEKFQEQADDLKENLAATKGAERFVTWMRTRCEAMVQANEISPNYSILITGSEKKQIPYSPCSSLRIRK